MVAKFENEFAVKRLFKMSEILAGAENGKMHTNALIYNLTDGTKNMRIRESASRFMENMEEHGILDVDGNSIAQMSAQEDVVKDYLENLAFEMGYSLWSGV